MTDLLSRQFVNMSAAESDSAGKPFANLRLFLNLFRQFKAIPQYIQAIELSLLELPNCQSVYAKTYLYT
jgi:hypothetical protein